MATASGNQLSVGAKMGIIFELNASGYPAASSTSAYEGLELAGIKGFEMASPNARMVTHTGNDRVLAVDFLPTQEAISGEIRIAPSLMSLNATLTQTTAFTVGETKMLPWATDEQGNEKDVSLLVFQQSLDKDTKLRSWRSVLIPRARVIPVLAPMNDNPSEIRYQIVASPSTKHIWGTALSTSTEGATEAAAIEAMTEKKPKIVAWMGDNVATAFSLPTNYPAASTGKMTVWVNGVKDATATLSVTTVTPTAKPGNGDMVVCFYEYN